MDRRPCTETGQIFTSATMPKTSAWSARLSLLGSPPLTIPPSKPTAFVRDKPVVVSGFSTQPNFLHGAKLKEMSYSVLVYLGQERLSSHPLSLEPTQRRQMSRYRRCVCVQQLSAAIRTESRGYT